MFRARALVVVYALSVAAYALIAHRHAFPNLFPDEMFYGKLSQGLAFGDGLSWRASNWGLPPLWPAVLSLAWHFGSVPQGYGVAKVIGVAICCLTVIPAWSLGRAVVGPRLALVPAALCVLGSWMSVTSYIVTENIAFPLATASLACTAMAMRDLRNRWVGAAAGFAALAALARTQMLALGVILLVALVLDVVRQPRAARRARIAARPLALWAGLGLIIAAMLLAFILAPGLTNYDVLAHHASPADTASTAGTHAASSIVMFAFLPVVAALALMLRPANWRDERVGPLLVTIAAAALVLYPLVARFEVWATSGSPVERYVMYLAPLLLVALVTAPGRIGRVPALAVGAAVVVALLAVPIGRNYIEQPALYGIQTRLFELSPFARDHLRLGLVLAAIPIVGFGTLALSSRRFAAQGLAFAVVLTGALMVTQTWTSQDAEITIERSARPQVLPPQLDWVDRGAEGDVAMLAIDKPQPLRGNSDLYTDFFNRKVKWLFAMPSSAFSPGACTVHVAQGGVLEQDDPSCAPWPREYVLVPSPRRATFVGQRVVAATGQRGVLVRLPAGPPRALALVEPPCADGWCSGALRVELHLAAPARLEARFSAAAQRHRIRVGDQSRTMTPGIPTTVRLDVTKGDQEVKLPVDWRDVDGAPQLQSVVLEHGGKRTRLY
ncbi:MAG TPA: hypothetical protein VF066_02075 [Thermoleophilaceae bacterium]